jgi:protein SDA1
MPHIKQVGQIFSFVCEAIHCRIPPEELQIFGKHIIDNFVTDGCTPEKLTMGLNALREMCIRAPLMLDEFHLNYVADFKKYRNKNVSSAAKSIINLYRDLNPKLLKKEHRGRVLKYLEDEEMENKILGFGETKVHTSVPGIELLMQGDEDVGRDKKVSLGSIKLLNNRDLKKIKYLRKK